MSIDNAAQEHHENVVISPSVATQIDVAMKKVESKKTDEQIQEEEDLTPKGIWSKVIRENAKYLKLIHSEFELGIKEKNVFGVMTEVNELEELVEGLVPALVKKWPDPKEFVIPVELVAIYTLHSVFTPKLIAIRDEFDAKKAEKLKEVNPDATATSA